jgi:hypothetical protein
LSLSAEQETHEDNKYEIWVDGISSGGYVEEARKGYTRRQLGEWKGS